MATNKLQWKRIAKGDKLPCQSFLRKKNGEILKLSAVAGVTVGQDAYYLPVDDVIEEIRNYPIEESEDEKMRKELFERFSHIKGFDWYGLPIKDILAWLGKQGEQKPADTEKGAKGNDREIPNSAWSEEDEKILSNIIKDLVHPWNEYIPDRIEYEIKWLKNKLKSLRPQTTWRPSDEQMKLLREVQQALLGKDCHNRFVDFMYELKRLREE